jgi:hypothetical protein
MYEQMLAATTSASRTGAVGATTGPLDGRALTHGVDAHAGEGAGSSAATLHRVTMRAPLCFLRFFGVLVEG